MSWQEPSSENCCKIWRRKFSELFLMGLKGFSLECLITVCHASNHSQIVYLVRKWYNKLYVMKIFQVCLKSDVIVLESGLLNHWWSERISSLPWYVPKTTHAYIPKQLPCNMGISSCCLLNPNLGFFLVIRESPRGGIHLWL